MVSFMKSMSAPIKLGPHFISSHSFISNITKIINPSYKIQIFQMSKSHLASTKTYFYFCEVSEIKSRKGIFIEIYI
jgi:hypothetical protein